MRDEEPELDCKDFDITLPRFDDFPECETDGHYRCKECRWISPKTKEEEKETSKPFELFVKVLFNFHYSCYLPPRTAQMPRRGVWAFFV